MATDAAVKTSNAGKLYLVASPIGNLQDISLRALEVLRQVDLVACEDTRHSLKLLNHYEISKPTLSLHDHNERQRTEGLLEKLNGGKNIAILSDAGTPLISDPGYIFVRAAVAAGIPVEAIPGPCALVQALVLGGLPVSPFTFMGFLPPKSAARRRHFESLKEVGHTLVFYESCHRIQKFLQEAFDTLGDRPVVLAREMTKKFEEIFRGPLSRAIQPDCLRSWKGEFVVLIGAAG